MSKPSPITYSLANWTIRYDPKDFEGNYEVAVTWSASVNGVKPVRHHKNFHNMSDCTDWLKNEIGSDEL